MIAKECSAVALYARVSSDRQAEARTIESQVQALQERIAEDGFELAPELCFLDNGYSGSTLCRPALERLRDVASLGGVDRLYVHSPDRLSRNYAYQVVLLEELEGCHVDVQFLNCESNETPESKLFVQMQGVFAQYERAKILERSRRGRLHRARTGNVSVLSTAPYGYRYISESEGGSRAEFQIVLDQAAVVRQVFEWVGRDRVSIREVCRRLQSQGRMTPKGNARWDRGTIFGWLKNPTYKGSAVFGKTRRGPRKNRFRPLRGFEHPKRTHSDYKVPEKEWIHIPVPPIVSENLFQEVQEQLAENRKRRRERLKGATHLLQGLLVCRRCKYALYGSRGKGRGKMYTSYYRCSGSDAGRSSDGRLCNSRSIRGESLEQAVWQDVCALLEEPERLQEELDRRLCVAQQERGQGTVAQLKQDVQRAKRSLARLIDLYAEGTIKKEEFEPRVKQVRARLENCETEIAKEREQDEERKELHLVLTRMEDFASQVRGGLKDADWNLRRKIITVLVARIEVDDEEVRVVYRVDPSPFERAPSTGAPRHCLRRRSTALPARHRYR